MLFRSGRLKGQRLCGKCNTIVGHNVRTCERRQLATKLMQSHQQLYGNSVSKQNVKVRIRNVLAQQRLDDEEEQDTEEDENYEEDSDVDSTEEHDESDEQQGV